LPPPDVFVVTTPYVPGYRILRIRGVTRGLIVRSRGLGRNITAGFRSTIGGEITDYTQLHDQTRREALQRLQQNALALGADAVISVGFDSSELREVMSEILAYGTEVQVEPEPLAPQPVALR
jgi:uncharacterized protein YbjQ (UPF0145 family)